MISLAVPAADWVGLVHPEITPPSNFHHLRDTTLVRVDGVLDLGWLSTEVGGLYCPDNGRAGIDPEVAVRLMLAGFLLGIVHDRRLMREAQVNLAIRWFVGYALHEALPDHSSLTRIRQRWGEGVFRHIFTRVVRQCQAAGLVTAETVHIDASLIRADVSMDALVARHLDAVEEASDIERTDRGTGKYKKLCRTDPDATMATSSKAPLRPAYKQHTSVGSCLECGGNSLAAISEHWDLDLIRRRGQG